MCPIHFPCSVLLHCFGSSPPPSHFRALPKAEQTPLFTPLLPYPFLPPPTRLSRGVTKAAHWAVPLLSGECQTCTGKRSPAFEILFRTDCCFYKSLYMVKILVYSFGGEKKRKKKRLPLKSRKLPRLGKPKRQLLVRKSGRIISDVCVVASRSSLPSSGVTPNGMWPSHCWLVRVRELLPRGSRCLRGSRWYVAACKGSRGRKQARMETDKHKIS